MDRNALLDLLRHAQNDAEGKGFVYLKYWRDAYCRARQTMGIENAINYAIGFANRATGENLRQTNKDGQ